MNDMVEIAKNAGNYSALGPAATAAQALKAMLGARIARILDARSLTVRAAAEATGYAAADFSRLRRGKLDRFTVDRLLAMLAKLEPEIELNLILRPGMNREWIINQIKPREHELREQGIVGLSLFGSSLRNEAREDSDLDMLLDCDPDRFEVKGMLDMQLKLEAQLGVPVHLTLRDRLKPEFRDRIEAEAVRLF